MPASDLRRRTRTGKVIISDKAMQAKAASADSWLVEAGARGAGRLVGRITPTGERRFYFRYSDSEGRQVRLLIGQYDQRGNGEATFTVQQARDRSRELSALYRSGIKDLREHLAQQLANAQLAEQAARDQAEAEQKAAALAAEQRITVQKLFDRWRLVDLTPHTRADGKRAGRKDGGQYSKEQFERHVFPSIGNFAASDVRKSDLMNILDALKSAGKLRTCNVLLADLKQMFSFALGRDLVERNPLDTVTKRQAGGTEAMRERVLSTNEIATLATLVPKARLNQRTAAAIWILLATGARIGELMGAAWNDPGSSAEKLAIRPEAKDVKVGIVNLAAKTWYLPTTKNEREHTIHLSEFAIKHLTILQSLREIDDENRPVPWVFPNSMRSGPVCVKSFGKQLSDRQRTAEQRMAGRSKQTDSLALPGGKWTAHDLRRTAGTLMASMGVSGDVIDECLNHVIESRVRRTYIRDRRPAEQARALEALGQKLEQVTLGNLA